MKSSLAIGSVALLSIGLLSGCSGMDHKTAHAVAQPVTATSGSRVVSDDAYIAAVERAARHRGVSVTWVNAPVRRIDPIK